jgi:[ribosomal protein S18]-alanine N-acetyltransferase
MVSEWIIRPAISGDDLVAIWREAYETDHAPLLPKCVHAPFEPRGEAYVAESGSSAFGFCYVDNEWLDEVWVAKAWQGRGVGTSLIRFAETSMSARGITDAALTVWQPNVRAIALYRQLGWRDLRSFVSKTNGEFYLRMAKKLKATVGS